MLAILFGCQQKHLGNFDKGHLGELFQISASSSGDVYIKIFILFSSGCQCHGTVWPILVEGLILVKLF